jgi:hypothetical protein
LSKSGSKTILRLACESTRRIDRREGRFAASLVAKIPTHGAARCTRTSLLVILRTATRSRKFSHLPVFLFLALQCGPSAQVSASGENEAEEIYHEISARRRCKWVRGDCANMFYTTTGRKSSNPCSWLSLWLVSWANLPRGVGGWRVRGLRLPEYLRRRFSPLWESAVYSRVDGAFLPVKQMWRDSSGGALSIKVTEMQKVRERKMNRLENQIYRAEKARVVQSKKAFLTLASCGSVTAIPVRRIAEPHPGS